MTAALVRGDALHLPLADNTVDLIVTSPPYFALRSYTDGGAHYAGQIGSEATPRAFVDALLAVTAECARVLKPSGSLFVNLGDKYSGSGGHNNAGLSTGNLGADRMRSSTLSGGKRRSLEAHIGADRERATRRQAPDRYNQSCDGIPAKSLMLLPERYRIRAVDELGLIARAVIIWDKPNGLPESVRDRVRRSHEDWVHLTKAPRYYAAVDEIREDYAGHQGGIGRPYPGRTDSDKSTLCIDRPNPLGKLPGSVWRIPSEPLQVPDHVGVDHYAAFPQEWPRRLILGWTPPGYCCECGEARTAVVDKQYERRAEHSGNAGNKTEIRNRTDGAGNAGIVNYSGGFMGAIQATITGYRCACPTPNAPTRPAVVLDPFAGTGTTVMVARALGRYGIGLDLSADYLRLATWRIWQSGHSAKTLNRTWTERQEALPLAGG